MQKNLKIDEVTIHEPIHFDDSPPESFRSFGDDQKWSFDNLNIIKELGKGPNSIVYEAVTKNGNHCALKVADGLTKYEAIQYMDQITGMDIALFSKNNDIKNVPRIYFHEVKVLSKGKFQYFIVTEKAACSLKDLHMERISLDKSWSEDELILLMYQIISFFCKIGDSQIYHKNLKETNILFSEDGNRIFISDFVSSKKVNHENLIINCKYNNMSEELLSHLQNLAVTYDPHKIEVYALGMIFLKLALMKNYLVFEGKQTLNSLLESAKTTFPRLYDIWKGMLQTESKRANFISIKNKLEPLYKALSFTTNPFSSDIETFLQSKKIIDWVDKVRELFSICKLYIAHKKLPMVIQKYTEAYNIMIKQDQMSNELIEKMTYCTREIAWYYMDLRSYDMALQYFLLQSDWIQKPQVKEIIGDAHIYHVYAIRDLGKIHLKMRHFNQSIEYCLAFLQLAKSLLGENHHDYVETLEDVAYLYNVQGNLVSAVEYYSQVFNKIKQIHGENHPDYLRILLEIIKGYEGIGDFLSAINYKMDRSKKIKMLYGENSNEHIKCLADIAETYQKLRRFDQSLEFYNLIFLIQKSVTQGKYTEEVIYTMEDLAKIYRKKGDYQRSLQLENQVLERKKDLYPGEENINYKFAKSWNNISVTLELLGNYNKGYECITKAFDIYQQSLGISNPRTQACLRNLLKIAEKVDEKEALSKYQGFLIKSDTPSSMNSDTPSSIKSLK